MKMGRDYIGVSAGAVVKDDRGRYFLARRSQGARDDQGCWEFPGGSVRMSETREQAAIRIIFEKYNLQIEVERLLGVYDVIDRKQGDHWLSTTFMCHATGGDATILIPDSCDEIGWFRPGKMRTLDLSRISALNLKDLLAGLEVPA